MVVSNPIVTSRKYAVVEVHKDFISKNRDMYNKKYYYNALKHKDGYRLQAWNNTNKAFKYLPITIEEFYENFRIISIPELEEKYLTA